MSKQQNGIPDVTPTITIRRYAVMAVDTDDSCDGRPRFLRMFDTYEQAREYVDADIEEYEDNGHANIDYDDMSCDTCTWTIEPINIEVDDVAGHIKSVLRRYFEYNDKGNANAEYDATYDQQSAIDDIYAIVGGI